MSFLGKGFIASTPAAFLGGSADDFINQGLETWPVHIAVF
jgi:hypothetical protein